MTNNESHEIDHALFIYNSDTYQKLTQTENGLYAESPSYVYELPTREYQTGVTA